mmetsp:Transcript_12132/g.17787  ORF Transcript_12132/g.17787 Transcript_12132/m.17787 type:complete len:305 (-) Transcript_12132:3257-4171(-)
MHIDKATMVTSWKLRHIWPLTFLIFGIYRIITETNSAMKLLSVKSQQELEILQMNSNLNKKENQQVQINPQPKGVLEQDNTSTKFYNPLDCKHMVNGHCQDEEGRAWSYRSDQGDCIHATEDDYPGNIFASQHLQELLKPTSVLDFGGGVGVYMRAFRDSGMSRSENLVVVEPQPLGSCLFRGLSQDTRDWLHLSLSELPSRKYDLTMTIEVLEHIPINFHEHLLKALTQASSKWLVVSAAHPGQPGEGHIGPSMKWRDEWIDLVHNWTDFLYDEHINAEFRKRKIGRLFRQNAAIFRRRNIEQ